jgi:hypothetical protein
MEKFASIIVAAIISITALIILFMSVSRIDRYLDIKAVEACSNSASYTKESSKEEYKAKYPIEDLYKNCISATQ